MTQTVLLVHVNISPINYCQSPVGLLFKLEGTPACST